jgi:hypothetical protein
MKNEELTLRVTEETQRSTERTGSQTAITRFFKANTRTKRNEFSYPNE